MKAKECVYGGGSSIDMLLWIFDCGQTNHTLEKKEKTGKKPRELKEQSAWTNKQSAVLFSILLSASKSKNLNPIWTIF